MNSLYFRLLFPLERDTRWLCEQRLCVFRYAQRDKLLFFLSILTRNTANNSIIIPLRRDVIGLDAFSVHSSHIWRKMFRAPVKHTYRTGHVCFAKFPLILEMMRFMKKSNAREKYENAEKYRWRKSKSETATAMPQTHDANVSDGRCSVEIQVCITKIYWFSVSSLSCVHVICLHTFESVAISNDAAGGSLKFFSTWLQHSRKSLPKTSIYIQNIRLSVAANKKVFDSENSVRIAAPSGWNLLNARIILWVICCH